MNVAVIVPFLNEEHHLEKLFEGFDSQTERFHTVVLVDDGSDDDSAVLAERYATGKPWVSLIQRPRRPKAADRLTEAPEYKAFLGALEEMSDDWEVVGKVDADIVLTPRTVECLVRELENDPRLGVVGTHLRQEQRDGSLVLDSQPVYHVRGATKFYRRSCWEAISPIAPILGWDTIDESKARMLGWATRSVSVSGGDPVHLRHTGTADGIVRGFERWGECAYASGFHPAWVALGTVRRLAQRPLVVGGAAYARGWLQARKQGIPRAEAAVRDYVRREQLRRIRRALAGPTDQKLGRRSR